MCGCMQWLLLDIKPFDAISVSVFRRFAISLYLHVCVFGLCVHDLALGDGVTPSCVCSDAATSCTAGSHAPLCVNQPLAVYCV